MFISKKKYQKEITDYKIRIGGLQDIIKSQQKELVEVKGERLALKISLSGANNKLENAVIVSEHDKKVLDAKKDGNYIYDETISESFHDYYLNGNNASKASLEIVAVLKTHLDRLGD